jgi:hypothetical protein
MSGDLIAGIFLKPYFKRNLQVPLPNEGLAEFCMRDYKDVGLHQ